MFKLKNLLKPKSLLCISLVIVLLYALLSTNYFTPKEGFRRADFWEQKEAAKRRAAAKKKRLEEKAIKEKLKWEDKKWLGFF